jgi:hypothetical protein
MLGLKPWLLKCSPGRKSTHINIRTRCTRQTRKCKIPLKVTSLAYVSFSPFLCLYVGMSACLSVCLFLSVCVPVSVFQCVCVCLSVCLCLCLSAYLLSVCLSACQPVCLLTCLFVCPFFCLQQQILGSPSSLIMPVLHCFAQPDRQRHQAGHLLWIILTLRHV